MADNSPTIDRNRFLALVLKSPTQMGWLSIINSVTNISRLGTFKGCFLAVLFAHTKECFIDNNLRIRMSFLDPNHKIPKNVVHSPTVMCTGIL